MKNKILLVLLSFFTFYAHSQQSDTSAMKHHELGVDFYPIAISVFKPEMPTWVGGAASAKPDYNFTYRYYFKKFAIKARFGINQNNSGESKTATPQGNITYINIVDAGYDRKLVSAIGFQYNLTNNKKSCAFIGLDILNNKLGTSMGTKNELYDSNANYISIGKSHYTTKSVTKLSGLALAFGVSFKIKQNIFFTIESSLRYTRSVLKNENTFYTYQYYECNGQPVSNNENRNSASNGITSSATEFIPTTNFTLGYRF